MGFGYGYSASVDHYADAFSNESGARVRKSFTTDMAAHVWAQESQTFGQSSKGVVYFHGRALFDYGAHYCAAYILPDESAFLYNASHVSPTTSGHVSTARYAARPRTGYPVPDLTGLLAGRADDSLHVRGPVARGDYEGTREWESDIDDRLADRDYIRAYCERHALELAPESMQFLLARVGLPKSAAKIRRDAERARDREEERRKREDRARAVDALRAFAKAESVESCAIAKRASPYDTGKSAARIADELASDVRSWRKRAGKDNVPVTYWREAWARLKALGESETVDSIARALDRRAGQRARAEARNAIRSALCNYRDGRPLQHTADESAHAFQRLSADSGFATIKAERARALSRSLARYMPGTAGAAIAALDNESHAFAAWASGIMKSDAMAQAREEWDAMREERERLLAEERERKERLALETWRAGGDPGTRIFASRPDGSAYIRATGVKRDESGAIVGGTLETSQGADVPLVQAVRGFRFIKLVRERGTAWHANGAQIRVGHFRVDRITTGGDMRAGCHRFAWQDIESLARSLGVFELAPDDSAVTRSREAA